MYKRRIRYNVSYTWYVYVITIIRNQHSIHTSILAAFPTDCLPASLASKTGSHVILKIFPGTQHVQADEEASAPSPAGRRLGLSFNLSVQFDNDQTTRYYNDDSWRDYRHLIFELSEPKILITQCGKTPEGHKVLRGSLFLPEFLSKKVCGKVFLS